MKSGKLTKAFRIDPKTLYRWTDEFSEFFSQEALGKERTHREYNQNDVVMMNTIMKLRAQRVETEEIRARLAAGDLDTTLPPEATDIPGDSAIQVYSRLWQLETTVAQYEKQLEQAREDLFRYEELAQKDRQRYEEQAREDRRHYEGEIGSLREQIGELKAELKFLKQHGKE